MVECRSLERYTCSAFRLNFVFALSMTCHPCSIGGSDLQPLTVEELSLVEEIMSGKFSILLAKEAKALLEDAASSSQKKGKSKRLPDTKVVDDPEAYKLSKAEVATAPAKIGMIGSVSVEPSPAKPPKKKKSSKGEGALTISLPADGSTYLDPSFVKDLSEALLLPADCKRLVDIGLVQSVE